MRKARKDINQVKMVQSKERKIQDFNESKSYLRVISPTLSNRIKSCKISKKRQCRKNIFLRLNIFDFLREETVNTTYESPLSEMNDSKYIKPKPQFKRKKKKKKKKKKRIQTPFVPSYEPYKLMKMSSTRCNKCGFHAPYSKFCRWAKSKLNQCDESQKSPTNFFIDKKTKILVENKIRVLEESMTENEELLKENEKQKKEDTIIKKDVVGRSEEDKKPEQGEILENIYNNYQISLASIMAFMLILLNMIPCVSCNNIEISEYHFGYILGLGTLVMLMVVSFITVLFYFNYCCCKRRNITKYLYDVEKSILYEQLSFDEKEHEPLMTTSFQVQDELMHAPGGRNTQESEEDLKLLPHVDTQRCMKFNENLRYLKKDLNTDCVRIAECDHQAICIRFDKFQNIEETFVFNKALETARKVENAELEELIETTEKCYLIPMQKNLGKGKKDESQTKLTSLKAFNNTKCSLISIVLSLFNMASFKSALYSMSMNLKLCSIGECEFCLIFSLFVRYETAKRTISPSELEGLSLFDSADESSIDVTFLNLLKLLEDSFKSNHQNSYHKMDNWFSNNISIDNHEKCTPSKNKYNFVENHSKTCSEEEIINSLCICGDIYASNIHWSGTSIEDKNNFIFVYENNPRMSRLKPFFEIDGRVLKMTSFINFKDDHFTCCIPDFTEHKMYLLEDKVISKSLDETKTPILGMLSK